MRFCLFLDILEDQKRCSLKLPLSISTFDQELTKKEKDSDDYPKTANTGEENERKGKKSIDRATLLCALISNDKFKSTIVESAVRIAAGR